MAATRAPTSAPVSNPMLTQPAGPSRTPTAEVRRGRRISSFWRHFLEMLAAMVVGMFATVAVFLSIVGLKTWDEVTTPVPEAGTVGHGGRHDGPDGHLDAVPGHGVDEFD